MHTIAFIIELRLGLVKEMYRIFLSLLGGEGRGGGVGSFVGLFKIGTWPKSAHSSAAWVARAAEERAIDKRNGMRKAEDGGRRMEEKSQAQR